MNAPVQRKKGKYDSGITIYHNPATGQELGREPNTDLSRMAEFMAQARSAQKIWAARSFRERKRIILKIRDYILANTDEIVNTVSRNSGKTRIDAMATEVIPSVLSVRWYATHARRVLRPRRPAPSSIIFINKRNEIRRHPLGVVGIISPWNYPLSIPFGEVIMALVAGNAVLLKVSAATTLVGLEIKKILAGAGLPDGLFRLLIGPGGRVLEAMLANGIDKLFFTGSTATGREVMEKAAAHLTPVSLELGGKDGMIVLADADLERATNGAAWAGYQNAGQSCGIVERVYVQETVYDRFVDLLARKTEAIRFGVDTDFNTEMGSMTTPEQWKIVERQVRDALDRGARIVARSGRGVASKGIFHAPLLLADMNHGMRIMREETFGPVIPLMRFGTIDEAVRMANDSPMGLTASVWTRNTRLGKKIAHRIEAGVVTINDHLYTHGQPETPWSGWKRSGIGATHSALGLLEMTRPKLVNWDILPLRRNVWWFPYDRITYDRLKDTLRMAFPRSPGDLLRGGVRVLLFMIRKMLSPWRP
ncbi:MAG: aldehyde dehydrogenase family protein [Spirochaetes bacterium]|nr:aldehyde dehydrogenase family protein [Spirochaetota bacterium]